MKNKLALVVSTAITPLASIFGSGFLVIVPILAGVVGRYSVFVMAGVCALAYVVGSVIRHNIKNVEPVLADNPSEATLSFERASDLSIILSLAGQVYRIKWVLPNGGIHSLTQNKN